MCKVMWMIFIFVEHACSVVDPSCMCGERQSSQFGEVFVSRVVDGDEVEINEFPWAALLAIQTSGGDVERCGGSLINDRFVCVGRLCHDNMVCTAGLL